MYLIVLTLFLVSNVFAVKLKQSESNNVFTDWRIGQKSSSARSNGAFAENIKCDKDTEGEFFSAMVTLPAGFGTVPVFNEASDVNPSISEECSIKQIAVGSNRFALMVKNFDSCGVQQQKATDGALWMSVSVRFPMIGSLRTADDEVITLMCRPQERIIVRNHVLDLKSQASSPLRTVFSSSPLDFDCNLDLFVKSDDNTFNRMAPNEDVLEVGQEVQLKATVRPGDGWKYVMLKDVTVHKVSPFSTTKTSQPFSSINPLRQVPTTQRDQNSNTFFATNSINVRKSSGSRQFGSNSFTKTEELDRAKRQIPEAAFLVLSDGCRNPVYRSIASDHPLQDPDDQLVVRFNFRAFMFQDMNENGNIRVTAKVIACVEEEDCRPNRCLDNNEIGFGRRRKRRSPFQMSPNVSQTEDFSQELQFQVVRPRFRSAFVNSEGDPIPSQLFSHYEQNECKFAIYTIGTIALMFCSVLTISSTAIVIKSKSGKP